MGAKRSTTALYVYMNEILVGTLSRLSTSELTFSYHDDWLNSEHQYPISLSMPLMGSAYKGDVVYNFFDNLLPDNDSIRRRIQAQFQAPSDQCFDLLAVIGADCIGALQLLTAPLQTSTRKINARALSTQQVAAQIKTYRSAPLGMTKDSDFRISLAGAQEKTALLWYENKWQLPKPTTPTSHIIKLPIGKIGHSGMDLSDSVENEWLCLQILSAFSLPVAQSTIHEFDGIKVLAVERFDRCWQDINTWLLRLPQEDMCQALGINSSLKYESDGGPGIKPILQLLRGAVDANQARMQFMKSNFLFWLLAAIDGHAKNFSISIKPHGEFSLTPLYDVISAYPLIENKQLSLNKIKMAMALKGKNKHYVWERIALRHWLSTARHCEFSEQAMHEIIEEVFDTLQTALDSVASKLPAGFPAEMADLIFDGMLNVKNKSHY
jgi:serine/threonine-protein kinase HipA